MLAAALTAVKAGYNELTLSDGIKYLSYVNVVMKLRCGCQQLVTAVKAGNSLYPNILVKAVNAWVRSAFGNVLYINYRLLIFERMLSGVALVFYNSGSIN